MNKNEQYKRLVKSGAAAAILTVEVSLYWLLWTRYYNPIIEMPFWRRGNWLILSIYAASLFFFLNTYGGLKIGVLRRGNIIFSHILSLCIANVMAYLQLALIDKRFHNPSAFLLLTLADILAIVIWVYLFQYLYGLLFPPRQLIVIYGERPVFKIMEKITSRDDKYIIAGAIHVNKGIDKIMEEVVKFGGVIIGDIPSHDRNLILKRCYDLSIRVYTVPKISDLLIRSSGELNLFDTPLLLSRTDDIMVEQMFLKRLLDLVLGGFLLLLTMPLFLIFGIIIKLTDGGSVFYTQKRLTKDGKVFDIIKFRTMQSDAEKDGVARLSGKRDRRITPVGKFLRAVRLDELPQLFNIIAGDMSLVGPRPERPEIAREYEKEMPEFRLRLKMKAGLTGYAQVHGKYNTTPYDKLKLDLTYIRNYSIWRDLKLILMTPKVLFMREATEGIEEGEFHAMPGMTLREEVYGRAQNLEERIGHDDYHKNAV